jgi:diphosphomevalonate decarboxylase
MHAAALSARPGIVFWKGPTIEGLHLARELRKAGISAYFTCDAGPQPKLLCSSESEAQAAATLRALPGIVDVIRCRLGGTARILD